MKEQLRGFSKIFSFTFSQHVKTKGYKRGTIVIALILFLIPALLMIGAETLGSDQQEEGVPSEEAQVQYESQLASLTNIITVDLTEDNQEDLIIPPLADFLSQSAGLNINVTDYGSDFDRAREDSKGTSDTLLLVTEKSGDEWTMNIITPDDSGLPESVPTELDSLMTYYADSINVANGYETNYHQLAEERGEADSEGAGFAEDDPMDGVEEIFTMLISYLNIMLLYFFVLIYGQGVANSVVMEKSSKLMENFLVSVKAPAIILGKVLAITLTGIIQLVSWIGGLVLGFLVGATAVRAINPDTDMMILEIFAFLKSISDGMFSIPNCILAVLFIASGMVLYSALAGIGGAMASKAEDLSSANILFTLILIASFLAVLLGGGLGDYNPIFDWIPFTSVMVTPAQVLIGTLPVWKSLACLAVNLVATVLAAFIAGKIYKTLALYRGDPVNPGNLIKMMRGKSVANKNL